MRGALVWMSASPQNSYVEILIPKGEGIRRLGLWDLLTSGECHPHEWDSCSFKRLRELASLFPMRTRWENETMKRALTQPRSHCSLALPASRMVRNQFGVYKLPSEAFCYSSPNELRWGGHSRKSRGPRARQTWVEVLALHLPGQ